jgi:hypothetical protein
MLVSISRMEPSLGGKVSGGRTGLPMRPRGICKIPKGWVNEDSVWVQYGDGAELDIRESQYRSRGYEPPFEELPICKGDKSN